MKPICVIPARRGSKRLPLKNLLPLAGKPMILYSIDAALESGISANVFVSTEDQEIAKIAERAGASIHIRPDELAGDMVSATDVCLELVETRKKQGETYDAILCLQPTSPLRTSEDIKLSWEHFKHAGADYLVSVTPVDPHFFHWVVHETTDGWRMYFGDKFLIERPLLPPVFRPNGAIKIGRVNALSATRNFFGSKLEVYPMPEERSIHIATRFEFEIVHNLIRHSLEV